jgi:hypothetical protein
MGFEEEKAFFQLEKAIEFLEKTETQNIYKYWNSLSS